MSTWIAAASGGGVGAASGMYASRQLSGRYARRGTVTLLLAATGAVLGIALPLRLHPEAVAAASLVLLAAALPLAVIDATTRLLPDKLVFPAIAACAASIVIAATAEGHYGQLERALAAAAVVFLAFTALALAVPGGLGFGDCKAAALCALPLGYLGWSRVLQAVLAAYLLAGLYILARRMSNRTSRSVAFGPFLFAGTLLALLAA